jgi:hypothetical protein
MMCACDERHGMRFLPHQLHEGQEYGTKRRIPVTLGFQPSICRECRGLPPVPCPKASIHGHTSKIKRFYWRELHFRKYDLLAELGVSSEAPLSPHDADQFSQIEARALEDTVRPILDVVSHHVAACDAVFGGRANEARLLPLMLWGGLHGVSHFIKRDRLSTPSSPVSGEVAGALVRTLLLGLGATSADLDEAVSVCAPRSLQMASNA